MVTSTRAAGREAVRQVASHRHLEFAALESATQRLRESPYSELRRVSCEFADGVLSLHGRVSSFYLKQIAQSVVFPAEGVSRLDNCLEVCNP